jgi:hypothetical protein
MPQFSSIKDLEKFMQLALRDALEHECAADASATMKKVYQEEIYSYVYNKDFRTRRMSLVDDTNIKTEMVDNNTLSITNVAQPDESVLGTPIDGGTQLAYWIENGDIPNIFNDRSDYPWTKPRPVTQHVVDEMIGSGSTMSALQKGLKRNGVNVTNGEIFLDIKVNNPRK